MSEPQPVSGRGASRTAGVRRDSRAAPDAAHRPRCLRCGFEVVRRPWGCKNPCTNCGFVYPLGDCSD